MNASFDIFRIETSGVRWLETAANLEEARARVQVIALSAPGEFLVLNQQTGNKLFIKLDGKLTGGEVKPLPNGAGN